MILGWLAVIILLSLSFGLILYAFAAVTGPIYRDGQDYTWYLRLMYIAAGLLPLIFAIMGVQDMAEAKPWLCDECHAKSVEESDKEEEMMRAEGLGLPVKLSKSIVMRPNEAPIGLWQVNYFDRTTAAEAIRGVHADGVFEQMLKEENTKAQFKAICSLIVTNQRIIFMNGVIDCSNIRRARTGANPIDVTDYSVRKSIGLDMISGITQVRNDIEMSIDSEKSSTIVLSKPQKVQISTMRTLGQIDPSSFRDMLRSSVDKGLAFLEEEKKRQRVQYVIDFSFLKSRMERGGVVLQTIKCPSCSASISLPATGTTFKCQYCGSMVYAEDIFEKMKGLIGGI